MADIYDFVKERGIAIDEWLFDIRKEIETYKYVIEGLEREKQMQLDHNMVREASNTEKLIHAIRKMIEECQKRYETVESMKE